MPDDVNTRLAKAEWEIQAIKEDQRQQSDKMVELTLRMDAHHKEVMTAIGSLKDDRAKAQGAAEARLLDAQTRQNRLKWLSLGLAVIGTLVALGWIGEAKAIMHTDQLTKRIYTQYYARDCDD